jgi:hypothetical protein
VPRLTNEIQRRINEVNMLKWKIAALVGLACGVGGVAWGYAQQQQTAPGFYELRVYTALPGRRDALAARFASRTAAIYARHGITNVGYWIPQQSDPELGISAEVHAWPLGGASRPSLGEGEETFVLGGLYWVFAPCHREQSPRDIARQATPSRITVRLGHQGIWDGYERCVRGTDAPATSWFGVAAAARLPCNTIRTPAP